MQFLCSTWSASGQICILTPGADEKTGSVSIPEVRSRQDRQGSSVCPNTNVANRIAADRIAFALSQHPHATGSSLKDQQFVTDVEHPQMEDGSFQRFSSMDSNRVLVVLDSQGSTSMAAQIPLRMRGCLSGAESQEDTDNFLRPLLTKKCAFRSDHVSMPSARTCLTVPSYGACSNCATGSSTDAEVRQVRSPTRPPGCAFKTILMRDEAMRSLVQAGEACQGITAAVRLPASASIGCPGR